MKILFVIIILFVFPVINHAQWIVQNSGTIATLSGVHFVSMNTGFAVGSAPSNQGIILKTTDGGDSWNITEFGTGSQ